MSSIRLRWSVLGAVPAVLAGADAPTSSQWTASTSLRCARFRPVGPATRRSRSCLLPQTAPTSSSRGVVRLDDVEEWNIKVATGHPGGDEGHPLHIHVNSFEVISVDGNPLPPGMIQP
jgi:hypothetical protein